MNELRRMPVNSREEKLSMLMEHRPIFLIKFDNKEYIEIFRSGYGTVMHKDWFEASWWKTYEGASAEIAPSAANLYKVVKITVTEEPCAGHDDKEDVETAEHLYKIPKEPDDDIVLTPVDRGNCNEMTREDALRVLECSRGLGVQAEVLERAMDVLAKE